MDSESRKSSSARKWWLLAGGIVVFVVAFHLLEGLLQTGPTHSDEDSAQAEDADAARSAVPVVRRLEDGAIEIRHDFFRRSTIRLGNEDDEKALFDCLAQGIEQTFGDGTEDWSRRRVKRETRRIQDECLGSTHDMPVPPRPPRPGD